MKHVIEVPAGHTVLVTREGLNVIIESHKSSDGEDRVIAMTNVQDLINTPSPFEPQKPKEYEPGTVLVWEYRKPFTENEKAREFIVYGSDNRPTCTLDSEKVLKVNPEGYHSDWYAIQTAKMASPAEREEFLTNLRDWYALTINESGELVNWRAAEEYSYEGISAKLSEYIYTDNRSSYDTQTYEAGNYFPEGFLTDERLTEYKATVQKLFNKWRGLCNE